MFLIKLLCFRFTEFFVEEVTNKNDLCVLVHAYLRTLAVNETIIEKVVSFYSNIKLSALKELNDGTGHRPHYRYVYFHSTYNHLNY